jgi:hypothetical protein
VKGDLITAIDKDDVTQEFYNMAINVSIRWLMADFDAGGEVKNDTHSKLEFVEMQA